MATLDLENQSLGRALLHMTWPMLFGILALMSFQLVDSGFIGQLGVRPLAALGFTLPMQQLIIGVQVGLGIATTAIISRTLGTGDKDRAKRLGGLVVIIGALIVALLCLILWSARSLILHLLGAQPGLMPLIDQYWVPWLLSAWLGAMVYFGYSLCRANGDTRLPGLLMVFTSLLNLGLDPLFIFVFNWGLPGAAWATACAFGIGCLLVYPRLVKRYWLTLRLGPLNVGQGLKQLLSIMGPAMLSQMLPPVSAMLATGLVAAFGSTAVGAWGLGTRLEFFSIMVVLALTMSVPPMIGRLLGSNQIERVRRLVWLAVRFVLAWQLGVAVLWLALSGLLASILTTDAQVGQVLQSYLLRVPFSYSGLGTCMLMVSVCNALGLPLRALLISGLRLFACYLPGLWIGSHFFGLHGLLDGALVGNLLAGLFAWLLYRQGIRHLSAQSQPGYEHQAQDSAAS